MVGSIAVCEERVRADHPPEDSCLSPRTRQISARALSMFMRRSHVLRLVAVGVKQSHKATTCRAMEKPGDELFEDPMPGKNVSSARFPRLFLGRRNGLAPGKALKLSATTTIAFRREKVEENRVGHPSTSSELRRNAELEEICACRVSAGKKVNQR
jgi:hypothetical protein